MLAKHVPVLLGKEAMVVLARRLGVVAVRAGVTANY